jgi:hypothetical protein
VIGARTRPFTLIRILAATLLSGACRTEVLLGNPDGGGSPDAATPAACAMAPAEAKIATIDESWGELRAIAVQSDRLYALFARGGSLRGVLAFVPIGGGAVTELAQVGADPTALAVDGSFAYVASAGSAEVFRVERTGAFAFTTEQKGVSAIAADGRGGASWALDSGAILGWDFASEKPTTIATSPRTTSLAIADSVLYVSAPGVVSAFDLAAPNPAASIRRVVDGCGQGAVGLARRALYCADGSAILRADLVTSAITTAASDQIGARDVVVAGGRAFWRAVREGDGLIASTPLDGIGGPTVVATAPPVPAAIAADRCALYFASGRTLLRRGL